MNLSAHIVDITTLRLDAIVNAANEQLAPGGGVCGAIHRAAGPELARACAALGGCPTGGARITPGFALPARYVIHAVGPVWHGGGAGEPARLASAYRESLKLAGEHALRSIAFPAISTGIFGYPLDAATAIAVETVEREAGGVSVAGEAAGTSLTREAGGTSVTDILFACFSDEALAAYRRAGVAA